MTGWLIGVLFAVSALSPHLSPNLAACVIGGLFADAALFPYLFCGMSPLVCLIGVGFATAAWSPYMSPCLSTW